jgi:hypothetical protein
VFPTYARFLKALYARCAEEGGPHMLNETLLERALSWWVQERGEGALREARRAFEEATGPIEEASADYEQRIAHFLEQHVCEAADNPIVLFAASAEPLSTQERRELAGWLRSHRSLFAFERFDSEGGLLRDCVFGGSYHVWPSDRDRQLRPGDHLDARLVASGDLLFLSTGRVYHPQEALDALRALLGQLDLDSLPRATLLNGLLAMRSRYLKFESVRAEHVYQARALAPVHLPLRHP